MMRICALIELEFFSYVMHDLKVLEVIHNLWSIIDGIIVKNFLECMLVLLREDGDDQPLIFTNKTNPKGNIDDSACPALKGLCHDSVHAWAVTVADCLWTNRKLVTCTRGNLHNSRFIVREARVFRTFLFDFIYPHNSYLFSGIPQINVAADKNKINNPVLLWNKHLGLYDK